MIVITFPLSSESLELLVSIVISLLTLAASLPAKSTKDTFVVYVLSANVSDIPILHVLLLTVP